MLKVNETMKDTDLDFKLLQAYFGGIFAVNKSSMLLSVSLLLWLEVGESCMDSVNKHPKSQSLTKTYNMLLNLVSNAPFCMLIIRQ